MTIEASIETDGSLSINADREARDELSELAAYRDRENTVAEHLAESYEFVQPEWIGALTDAPILTDMLDYPDVAEHPELRPDSRVWWFPDYMVIDPWETLAKEGRVVFTEAAPAEDASTCDEGRG